MKTDIRSFRKNRCGFKLTTCILSALMYACGSEPRSIGELDAPPHSEAADANPEETGPDSAHDTDVDIDQDTAPDVADASIEDADSDMTGPIDADTTNDTVPPTDTDTTPDSSDADTSDPCTTRDPCGACADDAYVPIGELGEPCGPCAASELICMDGAMVCDMRECACTADDQCEAEEECTAGVYSPEGWAYVAPGEFTKGCFPEEEFCYGTDYTAPVDMVLTWGLLVFKTELTEGDWQTTMGARTVYEGAPLTLPAVAFTFDEVATFLNLRSADNGLEECYDLIENETDYNQEWPRLHACPGWRLPTNAEWEYFARAGTTGSTWLGEPRPTESDREARNELDPLMDRIAYYYAHLYALQLELELDPVDGCGTGRGDVPVEIREFCRPIPVGRREPNPWGLYDIFGNVSELGWDTDMNNLAYVTRLDPVKPSHSQALMLNPRFGKLRFGFGGSFNSSSRVINPFSGAYFYANGGNMLMGFRPVRSLPGVRFGRTIEPR